jgi:threonine dehydrogenase-like Zn-dependent dehydrogenase
LAESRRPLVVDEIALPDALDAGQVLVKVLHTSICGAQINEIEAAKGPDKFLPDLLGREASARMIEGVSGFNAGTCCMAPLPHLNGHIPSPCR